MRAKLLDAQWLGVPGARKRVIIMGMRDDLGLEPAFPAPLDYRYSILDAYPWLAAGQLEVRQGGWDGHEAANLAAPDADRASVTARGADRLPQLD